jgi:hypothetical protein
MRECQADELLLGNRRMPPSERSYRFCKSCSIEIKVAREVMKIEEVLDLAVAVTSTTKASSFSAITAWHGYART